MADSIMRAECPFVNNANIGEYIDLEGIRMHYIEKGEGFPVVLVHGVGQSLYTWRNNIEALSEHFHVYAPDLLGHGYSDKPDIEYTISDHANMILAFMDALRIERAHIIGFGTGGTFALDFMIRNPERAEKAVIISPGGMTKNHPFYVRMLGSSFFGKVFIGMLNQSTVRRLLEETYFDQTGVEDKIVEEYTRPLMSGEAKSVILRCIGAYDDAGVLENLRLVEHPVLMFWGEDDQWHVIAMAELFHSALKNSELITIRNCGHMLHEEKFEKFNETVLEFLSV
jgi:pimeloyl-ACP methyl ester carboxylesterase